MSLASQRCLPRRGLRLDRLCVCVRVCVCLCVYELGEQPDLIGGRSKKGEFDATKKGETKALHGMAKRSQVCAMKLERALKPVCRRSCFPKKLLNTARMRENLVSR